MGKLHHLDNFLYGLFLWKYHDRTYLQRIKTLTGMICSLCGEAGLSDVLFSLQVTYESHIQYIHKIVIE